MRESFGAGFCAETLPGEWYIAASNLPAWISGERSGARVRFTIETDSPLTVASDLTFADHEGVSQTVMTTSVHKGDVFVRRGPGLARWAASRWWVAGASDDGNILCVEYGKSLVAVPGIDLLARVGTPLKPLRAQVARATEKFGLTPEEFGSLSWIPLRLIELSRP